MTDERPTGLCKCPFLASAAELERMAGCGIIPTTAAYSVTTRVRAILIGTLRAQGKCPGLTKDNACPLDYAASVELDCDPNIPLLKRHVEDGQDHFYN